MTFPDPTPGPGEVVIEMKASGMCGSDLHQYRRPKNQPPTRTGLPPDPKPRSAATSPAVWWRRSAPACSGGSDDRRARHGPPLPGCTQCSHCRSGWQQLCQEVPVKVYGSNSHGGHAKYLKVPANTLVPLPDDSPSPPERRSPAAPAPPMARCGDEHLRPRYDRDLRAGAGRPRRHPVRQGDGRAGDRAGHQPAAPGAREGVRRR